jgi:hypothetical protein
MVLFTDQRKFHRPGAGTSPAHEAGIPTNYYLGSWNDGPPGRFVQNIYTGFAITRRSLRYSSLQV